MTGNVITTKNTRKKKEMTENTPRVNNTMGKMAYYLGNHGSICVSVSGGSDSDIIVHMIATYFRQYLPKIHFVFVDTGLEWEATREHIKYLQSKYDIEIDTVHGTSIVTAVRTYGVPVISKYHSAVINGYCRDVPSSIRKINATKEEAGGYAFSPKHRALADACKIRGILISSKCCDKSKKDPFSKYAKKYGCDLSITGERKVEGGQRAAAHKNCFEPNNHGKWDKYMPLFYWNDETKQYYKECEGIVYSDCYEVYGMKRTGCAGCPFNSRVNKDLKLMQKYQPNLLKACLNTFGISYSLMDEFNVRKVPTLEGIEYPPNKEVG